MITGIDTKPRARSRLTRLPVLCLLVLVLALGLSACGRKNAPAHPAGATYPKEYPTE